MKYPLASTTNDRRGPAVLKRHRVQQVLARFFSQHKIKALAPT
ncbi:hypothetical protein N644_0557 [Lactiplantibacillus paraplantarum]|nr:hypothetical protein N644_0557 [Lactiplantibacillus paraplantarum]